MFAMLFPVSAIAAERVEDEYSTPLTVTLPEQPKGEMIISPKDEILKDITLPKGWEWKEPDTSLVSGGYVEATADIRMEMCLQKKRSGSKKIHTSK